ncbi:MAG TPA: TIGR04084 family radical SAM/SPASM domain-containing protein [Methanoregula sp.]|nr:TIGR04084 family radical SAM/SPASM domain-containing protein [Methanoregula sp.]
MYFHLILTDDCNLCCSYCRARVFENPDEREDTEPQIHIDPHLPPELNVNLDLLYGFLSRDPSPSLTFYGGEPLLRTDLIERIMREAPAQRFMIQTNGLLLDKINPKIVNRFSTILVSIDGREELNDANRGKGTYRKVIENIKKICRNGYKHEMIARMTVTESTDIVGAVHWLSDNPDYSFSSIHWQLDANFSHDFSHRSFTRWVNDSYNPGIFRLVKDWVDHMENTGEVLYWYPFLDPMEDLLLKRESGLRCGSGYANYSIMTDGNIAPCPVMLGMSEYYVGHVRDADPQNLKIMRVNGECAHCRILSFCGGRCLYSNITKPWGEPERQVVCSTVENLHRSLTSQLPRVKNLLASKRIDISDFSHEKYNGCEIIP